MGVLGKGGFGTVRAGVRARDGRGVAIKHVARKKVLEWTSLNGRRVPLELKLLQNVQSVRGVIKLLDFYEKSDSFIYVLEKPSHSKDLFDFITDKGSLEEELAKNFFKQITDTVIACHKNGVVHRDIKDENVIIDLKSGKCSLIDFGSGAVLKDEDICSADVRFRVPGLSRDCQELILACLRIRPKDRISLEAILQHPWMSDASGDISLQSDKPEYINKDIHLVKLSNCSQESV